MSSLRLRFLFVPLAALFLAVSAGAVRAELIGTDRVAPQGTQPTLSAADRELLKQQLQALGVPAQTAQERVGALTDEDVQKIAGRLDALPAGGFISTHDWLLILLIVLLVAIIV